MWDGSDFMQDNWEQDYDSQGHDTDWETTANPDPASVYDPLAGMDPTAHVDPTANFDPLVQDALKGAAGIGPLVDETIANLPDQTPTSGPFAGLEGGVPGGSGTEDLAGFINGRGADISGMIDRIESGQDLTDGQVAQGQHILHSGMNTDPLLVGDHIHDKAIDDLERYTYGNTQTDSSGQTWHYSPETDGWYKVGESGGLTPTDETPPFQRIPRPDVS